MPLITLIVLLVIVGVILWGINTYLPIDANIKKIINIVIIVVVCLWLLSVFGILPNFNAIRVGG